MIIKFNGKKFTINKLEDMNEYDPAIVSKPGFIAEVCRGTWSTRQEEYCIECTKEGVKLLLMLAQRHNVHKDWVMKKTIRLGADFVSTIWDALQAILETKEALFTFIGQNIDFKEFTRFEELLLKKSQSLYPRFSKAFYQKYFGDRDYLPVLLENLAVMTEQHKQIFLNNYINVSTSLKVKRSDFIHTDISPQKLKELFEYFPDEQQSIIALRLASPKDIDALLNLVFPPDNSNSILRSNFYAALAKNMQYFNRVVRTPAIAIALARHYDQWRVYLVQNVNTWAGLLGRRALTDAMDSLVNCFPEAANELRALIAPSAQGTKRKNPFEDSFFTSEKVPRGVPVVVAGLKK